MQEFTFLKTAEFFLQNPYEEVYLRQLAKKLKLSPFAVKKYADILIREGLINEERKANLRYFKANTNNLFFRYLKISLSMRIIIKSGLIDFLKQNIANVSSIVLFGSIAKGGDDPKSDADILIIGKEKYLDLGKFQEALGKEITLHIFSWSEWNSQSKDNAAFYLEIISYGIPLYGELPLVHQK
ncbi:nucleotidyltransferase domain-containing protein [Candidatus Woesearchaeota archaeon]|nr:nucleotidyltransferase domain-containing protein [Candidatus Woesearchaeota archaeon]